MASGDILNKMNLKKRSDYGVRVARPGYDANNCAQNQLLFNSGWPILQIAKVIDLSKMVEDTTYRLEILINWKDTQDPWSPGHYGVLSDDITEVSEPPAGYTGTYSFIQPTPSLDDGLMVNRKYVRRDLGGTATGYTYPNEVWTEGNIEYTKVTTCRSMKFGKIQHRLGYTPFFMASEHISGTSGYVVLFSIDITKDVDYPYTEEPLAFLSGTKDYGIKSSSIFGDKIPGLCSNMFSKLVQAVKTQETSADKWGGVKAAVWSPVRSAEEGYNGVLAPYEVFAFNSQYKGDGGYYYYKVAPAAITYYGDEELVFVGYTWAMSAGGVQSVGTPINSLVVLRSPMVSPEYEERTIS